MHILTMHMKKASPLLFLRAYKLDGDDPLAHRLWMTKEVRRNGPERAVGNRAWDQARVTEQYID